jgi:hypothetical protein
MEVCMSVCRAPESYFISSGDALGVMTGQRALMGIPNGGGFSLDAKGFFNETVFMVPKWGFSTDSTPRGKSLCVFG